MFVQVQQKNISIIVESIFCQLTHDLFFCYTSPVAWRFLIEKTAGAEWFTYTSLYFRWLSTIMYRWVNEVNGSSNTKFE